MRPKVIITVQSEDGTKTALTIHEVGDDTWELIIRDLNKMIIRLDEAIGVANKILGKS